uniref:Xrn1 N-terminal domain-containing protein n=1 Tax=viral metagenome TaxID=1070528 RepID=A0A6C0M0E9_9ZZZZ
MGIPAYYSYLIKNYKKIIIKKKDVNKTINNFYLDSNSIIYNCLSTMNGDFSEEFINNLIKKICLQIDSYIKEIQPTDLVYISFDGVAPFAKLKQQKERRFKSKIVTELLNDLINEKFSEISVKNDESNIKFDRTCITPGTYFMQQMDKKVAEYFNGRERFYNIKKIIVSTSNERGEGEHKIFDYIRNNNKNESHVIYGLDADLIILCLNHMHLSKDIYLFRETPEFIKSLLKDIEPNELYLMKIEELMYYILDNMVDKYDSNNAVNIIKDYVFIMFLLGNDFMPHFPSLNIRTHGIEMLLQTYKNILGKKKMFIIKDDEIVWKHFRELIEEFSSMELENLKREYRIRDKQEKRDYQKNDENTTNTEVEMNEKKLENVLLNLPIKERDVEKIINPNNFYWENRYYEELFNTERNEENLKKICLNYIEGLEWNMLYYTSGCKNWKWKYKYSYPPLFKDLLNYLPLWSIDYISENVTSIDFNIQLAYVLPPSSMYLLPKQYRKKMIEYKEKTNDVDLQWAFCRYFWESHIDFKMEKIEEIEEIFAQIDKTEKNIEFIVKDEIIF